MAGEFDPYRKWLGIPPTEQPPHHYRLLGVALFEADEDVIDHAADRQMAFLHGVSDGRHADDARRLLDEVANARRCLLTPSRRQAYDDGLRAGMQSGARNEGDTGQSDEPVESAPSPPPAPPPRTEQLGGKNDSASHDRPAKRSAPSRAATGKPSGTRSASQSVAAGIQVNERRTALHPPRKRSSVPLSARTRVTILLACCSAALAIGILIAVSVWSGRDGDTRPIAQSPAKQPNAPPDNDVDTDIADDESVIAPASAEVINDATTEEEGEKVDESDDATAEPESHVAVEPESFEVVTPASAPEADVEPVPEQSDALPTAGNEVTTDTTLDTSDEVADDPELQSTARGTLLREVWRRVPGKLVDDLVAHLEGGSPPDEREAITQFEPPEDYADNYGQRLSGYLHPPSSGEYRFQVHANAEARILLSTDESPDNTRLVEPDVAIELTEGHAYFVEVLHKESTGRDYVRIGWTRPDGVEEDPIPGERLSIAIPPAHARGFVVLPPVEATTDSGTLTITDGKTLHADEAEKGAVYEVAFQCNFSPVRSLRLEALPSDLLPAGGPGLGPRGRFSIAELAMSIEPVDDSSAEVEFELATVTADQGARPQRLIDGDIETAWSVAGRGQAATIAMQPKEWHDFPGGSIIRMRITNGDCLGAFRLLATSSADPLRSVAASSTTSDATPPAANSRFTLHVNLGGVAYVDSAGQRWEASKIFDNKTFGHEGGRAVVDKEFENPVVGSAQRGLSSFRAAVPAGSYDVTLFFCERWSRDPARRRFSVAIEGNVVAREIDLLTAAGGFGAPLAQPFPNITVDDGRLDIEFQPATDSASAILNAIQIERASPTRTRRGRQR